MNIEISPELEKVFKKYVLEKHGERQVKGVQERTDRMSNPGDIMKLTGQIAQNWWDSSI